MIEIKGQILTMRDVKFLVVVEKELEELSDINYEGCKEVNPTLQRTTYQVKY